MTPALLRPAIPRLAWRRARRSVNYTLVKRLWTDAQLTSSVPIGVPVPLPTDTEFFRDAHQVCYRNNLHLMHHASAVDLDVLLAGSEVGSDAL